MKQQRRLSMLLFGGMLSLGFYDAVRGALLPTIRLSLNLPYGTIGLVLFVAGLGYPLSVLFGGILADRFGSWRLAVLGYLLMAGASGFAPAVSGIGTFAILILLIHLGLGLLDVALNAIGGALFITKTALMMSYLHLFFGLGASLSPGYASLLLGSEFPWQTVYLSMLLLVLPFMVMAWRAREPRGTGAPSPGPSAPGGWTEAFRAKDLWLFVLLLGLGVSFEIGVATWHSNFLVAVRGYSPAAGATYLSFFFAAFTVGRLTGGHIVEGSGYHNALVWAPIAAVVFFVLGILVEGAPIITSLSGYFIGVFFPTVIAVVSRRYVLRRSSIIGIVMAGGTAMQMLSTWVVALAHEGLGELLGFASICLFGVAMAGLGFLFRRRLMVSGESPATPPSEPPV
ncbi:MAG: MFS transporter [Spirochaetota bacterium]